MTERRVVRVAFVGYELLVRPLGLFLGGKSRHYRQHFRQAVVENRTGTIERGGRKAEVEVVWTPELETGHTTGFDFVVRYVQQRPGKRLMRLSELPDGGCRVEVFPHIKLTRDEADRHVAIELANLILSDRYTPRKIREERK